LRVTRSGGLLVAGTASDAGKSLVTAGICRWLVRRGVRVAPFKAQNMALNSAVTPGGHEIGRAQAMQAAAAKVVPEATMNPVLLKPSGERDSQVVVMGRPAASADARSYQSMKRALMPVVLSALEDLRSRFDVVVCEGAGSPAEVNLRDGDLANMGLARAAGLPVVVVGDIDRGGVMAALYGTVALLDRADQALVAGFVVNKFRGDPGILAPGLRSLEHATGRPVLGVLPWVRGLWLDVEDSLALEAPRDPSAPPPESDELAVAVVRLPRMSNFTDVDALAREPGVSVRFTESAAEVRTADLVVLPGTKATVSDLSWLRGRGLARAIVDRARAGLPVLGVCGGYQMLGHRIVDAVESRAGEVEGLGLLPVETVFGPDKVLGTRSGTAPSFGDAPVEGYEIRHGRVSVDAGLGSGAPGSCGPVRVGAVHAKPVPGLAGGGPGSGEAGSASGEPLFVDSGGVHEGWRAGAVLGTSWHGVMESDAFRRAFGSWVAGVRGLRWLPGTGTFAELRERRLDRLGDLIEEHVDGDSLLRLIEQGPPRGLPYLPGWPEDRVQGSVAPDMMEMTP
jgi:adenosylcobyric acid synthase